MTIFFVNPTKIDFTSIHFHLIKNQEKIFVDGYL